MGGRVLTTVISTAIGQRITNPAYLIELGFTPIMRCATHKQIVWDGEAWYAVGIEVQSVSAAEASFSLRNPDNAISALVLTQRTIDLRCRVFQMYDTDAELIFDGVLGQPTDIGSRVQFLARSHVDVGVFPDERIGPPLCNFITPAGTVIKWGSGTLELEAEES